MRYFDQVMFYFYRMIKVKPYSTIFLFEFGDIPYILMFRIFSQIANIYINQTINKKLPNKRKNYPLY